MFYTIPSWGLSPWRVHDLADLHISIDNVCTLLESLSGTASSQVSFLLLWHSIHISYLRILSIPSLSPVFLICSYLSLSSSVWETSIFHKLCHTPTFHFCIFIYSPLIITTQSMSLPLTLSSVLKTWKQSAKSFKHKLGQWIPCQQTGGQLMSYISAQQHCQHPWLTILLIIRSINTKTPDASLWIYLLPHSSRGSVY